MTRQNALDISSEVAPSLDYFSPLPTATVPRFLERISIFNRKAFALFRRGVISAVIDKGRVADLIIFPLSFLVIWGLFVNAEVVPAEHAITLLLVQLIWSIASSYQMQANFLIMYDIWAGEMTEVLRSGVTHYHYLAAKLLLATVIGSFNLTIFYLSLLYIFEVPTSEANELLTTWPAYYLAALALSLPITGAVIRLGRSYAFLTWTTLQIVIMFSSPFNPVEALPRWLQWCAWASPFTYIFEYIRFRDSGLLSVAVMVSMAYAVVGFFIYDQLFKEAKRKGRLTMT